MNDWSITVTAFATVVNAVAVVVLVVVTIWYARSAKRQANASEQQAKAASEQAKAAQSQAGAAQAQASTATATLYELRRQLYDQRDLILHGIDQPNLWHGNTLTGNETYGGLYQDAPSLFDVVLTNPPFGGKEGKEAQTSFAYKTSATQVLFLQHVIDSLKSGGRCGIVLDEGVLFRNNENAFVQTKRKLLDDCDLWCIVSLPGGAFTNAGAGVKTNLLFFTKGKRTESVWYYDLSDIKVGKKTPLTANKFENFFELLPARAASERSWTVTREEIVAKNYDLKAVNPNAKSNEDTRTPEQLLDFIEEKGKEVAEAIAALRSMSAQ